MFNVALTMYRVYTFGRNWPIFNEKCIPFTIITVISESRYREKKECLVYVFLSYREVSEIGEKTVNGIHSFSAVFCTVEIGPEAASFQWTVEQHKIFYAKHKIFYLNLISEQ